MALDLTDRIKRLATLAGLKWKESQFAQELTSFLTSDETALQTIADRVGPVAGEFTQLQADARYLGINDKADDSAHADAADAADALSATGLIQTDALYLGISDKADDSTHADTADAASDVVADSALATRLAQIEADIAALQ